MKRFRLSPIFFTPLTALFFMGAFFASTPVIVRALQQTLTPVAAGMYITVITDEPQINVRMGPSSSIYPVVGTLLTGSTAPALGRSSGGDWIQIEYPGAPNNAGWVYSPLVQVSPGALRIAEPPPTPIPPATSTIDPTLAAQFNILPTNTRLPTFTPPPPLSVPSYTEPLNASSEPSFSLGLGILVLAALGSAGFLLSLFLRR